MNESFLHYLWQFQYFAKDQLTTTEGDPLQVIQPGIRNTHAGPDFFQGEIHMDGIQWIGNVEIHIYSSSWVDHQHHTDKAYENVILHVVWSDDKPVLRADGSRLPTIELKSRVSHERLLNYKKLIESPEEIPCATQLDAVQSLIKLSMLDRALLQRLEKKADVVQKIVERNRGDWEETTYQLLAKNFGFHVNAEPFEQLALALPYSIIRKHASDRLLLEALLFGQAGFLENGLDEKYYQQLQNTYSFLQQKYHLQGTQLNKAQWRFLRLRPANFPTIRIAQLAALLQREHGIFATLMATTSIQELTKIFTIKQSDYWNDHYQFAKTASEKIHSFGQFSQENIIINSVIPLWVAYGKSIDNQEYIDRAFEMLQHINHEKNKITTRWKELGMPCKTAFDSQALVELHTHFCSKRRCLDCTIGVSLMNSESK